MRQLLVHCSSHRREAVIPCQSRDFDPRPVDDSFVTPSGCGRHCATPFLRRVRCRAGAQTLKKSSFRTVLFSVLVASSEASDWPPIALGDGITQWADSLLQGRERGIRVPLPAAQYDLHVFLKYMAVGTSVYVRAPGPPRGSRGYAPMVADGWVCSLLHAVHQMLSLLPCTFVCLLKQWRGPKCRKSGHLAADTTKSSGSLHSLQMTPSHRSTWREIPGSLWADIAAACPQSWEFCGDDQIHWRGNHRHSVNGIQGQRPENRARQRLLLKGCGICWLNFFTFGPFVGFGLRK